MSETPAQKRSPGQRSTLRNVAKYRELRDDSWRAHLDAAIKAHGHTRDSFAAALGMTHQHITRLFDPYLRRPLNADLLERMRDTPETYDVWRTFIEMHVARGDEQKQVG